MVKMFKEIGSVNDLPIGGRFSVSEATVEHVRHLFRCPKSTCEVLCALQISQINLVRILYKMLRLYAYKVQDVLKNTCRELKYYLDILSELSRGTGQKTFFLSRLTRQLRRTFKDLNDHVAFDDGLLTSATEVKNLQKHSDSHQVSKIDRRINNMVAKKDVNLALLPTFR
ncbi:hypothetical protein TNCV_1964611 [Trichonephila clavipes]|nr:hypothetical protein TNCV_1964611 [Trichonephila clavipes]